MSWLTEIVTTVLDRRSKKLEVDLLLITDRYHALDRSIAELTIEVREIKEDIKDIKDGIERIYDKLYK